MVQAVLKTLADARLVTIDQETAEVAHEALNSRLANLAELAEEDREGLRLHRHLTECGEGVGCFRPGFECSLSGSAPGPGAGVGQYPCR